MLPNSAPDSLTPKNLNLVRVPEQTVEAGAVAVVVPPPAVGAVVGVPVVPGAAVAVVPELGGWHW